MSAPTKTRQWILVNKPSGTVVLEGDQATFKLVTADVPSLKENQVLVKALFLSNDPAMRGWISSSASAERSYLPPVPTGGPMRAYGVGEVVDSKSDRLKRGTQVVASTNWSEYTVLDEKDCQAIREIPGVSNTHYLGALGFTGLTAYYGLVEVLNARPSDAVVISGAAGATGSMVVQIAKHLINCKKVIGIAGSEEKCRWVEKLGADVCLNYKKDSFEEDLVKATDGFVELFFDNVGGSQLDLMLKRMKRNGKIAACGAISNYNAVNPEGLKNYFEIISNRLEIKGFIVVDFMHRLADVLQIFQKALKEGKLKVSDENETVVETKFEDVPKTWLKLFEGSNQGKLVTKLV